MFLKEPSHWIILAVVVLVLFGGRRLPEAARGIGRSLRIFKSEIRQMNDDDAPKGKTDPVEGRIVEPGAPVPPAQPVQPPVQTPSGEPRRDV